jgi:lipocalin
MMMSFRNAFKRVEFKERMQIKAELIEALRIKPRTFEAYIYSRVPITEEKRNIIAEVFKRHGIDNPFDVV